jgi:nitroreductase
LRFLAELAILLASTQAWTSGCKPVKQVLDALCWEAMDMLRDIVVSNRSYRRFFQDVPIDRDTLVALVDLSRLSASGANRQPLKYALSCDRETNARIFPTLAWAGYLTSWPGPEEGERPSAYIVILGDTEIAQSFGIDHGFAAQSIMLGAAEKGLGGCIIASIRKDALREALEIPSRCEILLVLALGKPKEQVQIDAIGPDGDIKYWRDAAQVHHVPKRSLEDIIVEPK